MYFLNDKLVEPLSKMFSCRQGHLFCHPEQRYIIKQLWKHYFIDAM